MLNCHPSTVCFAAHDDRSDVIVRPFFGRNNPTAKDSSGRSSRCCYAQLRMTLMDMLLRLTNINTLSRLTCRQAALQKQE